AAEGDISSRGVGKMTAHIVGGGGKRLRPALTLLTGKLFHCQLQRLIPMAAAIELLHTATLIHDDIIDRSPIRRSKPTVNALWGDDNAILFGDYLFACAGRKAAETEEPRISALLSQTLMAITQGEIKEGFNSYNLRKTREEYYRHIGNKTASLLSAAAESGAILGQASNRETENLKDYGYNLGMAFQIIDDILDFTGSEKGRGKPVGVDLNMGIVSLPAILFLEQAPEDNILKHLFENRNDAELLKKAVEMIASSPAVTECTKTAHNFCSKARKSLKNLPAGEAHRSLDNLAYYVAEQA
ncbi:MAG: polyprenyl synthetase family protein, partial [Dehalococcoidia bacterium]|nr:polyprenyl synthetase family protein [Dehalococcoidia bacterium]